MHSFKNYLLHGIYLTLYALVKYLSFPFFNYLRFGVLRIFSADIKSAHIGDGVTIWFPWNVKIGKRSSLNQGVIIDGFGCVNIGRGVRIAPYVCINTADHQYDDPETLIVNQGFVVAKVIIEDDVWVGTGAKINKGVRIGKGSVIGSGSVVIKDVPPYSIAAGVPCRVIKSRK
ncbi:MAG: acyltransferase [Deltaproteobacteria bacterium]|nr:acyltransferase [Deltaproteobacteria bacterium]